MCRHDARISHYIATHIALQFLHQHFRANSCVKFSFHTLRTTHGLPARWRKTNVQTSSKQYESSDKLTKYVHDAWFSSCLKYNTSGFCIIFFTSFLLSLNTFLNVIHHNANVYLLDSSLKIWLFMGCEDEEENREHVSCTSSLITSALA